ncbi:MAG TPA: hypothetical protein PKJ37_07670 [Acidobacteriota bacterium]|nr:hypothetical protein [Acidobacteriota bacterium]HNT17751.1 hypothetical protein [Acidobacteriota bacterium]
MRRINLSIVFLMVYLFSVVGFCSDGVDRHRKFGPNTLYLFTEPSPGCGYAVLPKDSEGGADGTIEFRWVQEHMQALVRVCAYETEKELGPGKYPLTIFDGSAENGDTPVDWEPSPRGRHPGNSHDGGINLDLGYYLTSLEGKGFTPDYAACTEHFENGKDAWICKGPADRLDTPRMTYFYIQMFSINRELFGGALLGQIGADYYVREAVINQLKSWAKEKKHGATHEILDDFKRVVTCDEYEGWAGSHHHHTHIRLNDIDLYGNLRPAVEKLLQMERDVDLALAGGKPFLRARLLSSGLERAVEAELTGKVAVDSTLRFNADEKTFLYAQKGDPRNRAVLTIVEGPVARQKQVTITAEMPDGKGGQERYSKVIALPAQDPRLYISIDPAQIKAEVARVKGDFLCEITWPAIYGKLVTKEFFEVVAEGKTLEFLAEQPGTQVRFSAGFFKAPFIINACVTTCGRKTFRIPVYVEPAPAAKAE